MVDQCRNARNLLFCNLLCRVVRRRSDISANARSSRLLSQINRYIRSIAKATLKLLLPVPAAQCY